MNYLIFAIAIAIFLVDSFLPLGVAGGVPYVILVLLSLRSQQNSAIWLAAGLGTVLTVAGYFFSPSGGELWVVLTNRLLAIFAIWVTALLAYDQRRFKKEVAEKGVDSSILAREIEKENGAASSGPFFFTHLIPVIIFVTGAMVSTAAFFSEKAEETEKIEMRLEEESSERFISIESEFDHLIDSVIGIKSLFAASENVTRSEFHDFVGYSLQTHKAIQALEWIPRAPDEKRKEFEDAAVRDGLEGFRFTERQLQGKMAPAARRDVYFPVYYLEPLKGNEAALGFDLASNQSRLLSLDKARDTGNLVATAKITLVQATVTQPGFLLFMPVYIKGAPVSSAAERRAAIMGFALGVLKIGDLLDTALKDYPPEGIHSTIFDLDAPKGDEFLYHYTNEQVAETAHEQIKDIVTLEKGLSHSEILDVGGRKWKVVFTPTAQFLVLNKGNRPYEYLIFGLIITGAMVTVSILATSRTEKIKRLVDIKTEELRRSLADTEIARDKTAGIIKSVADGVLVTDTENVIVLINKAVEDLLGFSSGYAIGRKIDDVINDKSLLKQVKDAFGKKEAGKPFDFVWESDSSAQPRVMNARTSVIYDREEVEIGIVTIIHDVTHERDVDRMKTEFISTAAHELRTPLTTIQGFSELLITKDDLSENERSKFLHYINDQAVGLGNIVTDLLNISRIESGHGLELKKEICMAGETIRKIVPYFEKTYNDYTFELTLPQSDIGILLDKEKMGQVLKNLISNAVKYSSPEDIIKISSKIEGDSYNITVEDHGIGMSKEQVSKVFDKFYRVDSSDSAPEGTGLGMTISMHIVVAHGGTLTVDSEPGKGSIFTIRLPINNNKEVA